MIDFPCVILAGGKSSRMEEDKCFLPFKNTTLIKYQYDRLSKIFSDVYISCKSNKFDFDCNLLIEENDIFSPLVALQNILKKFDKVFIISVDTPNITKKTIHEIVNSSDMFNITIAKTQDENTHNLIGVFNANILNHIDKMLKENNHKISILIKSVNSNIVSDLQNEEFINLNTKDDYYNIINN